MDICNSSFPAILVAYLNPKLNNEILGTFQFLKFILVEHYFGLEIFYKRAFPFK
jgi:hypothetical protein